MDGGEGTDSLVLNLTGATEFSNGTRGFETITVTGAAPLTVGGAFEAGQTLNFGDDDNQLVLASGSTFAGTADGAGGVDTLTVHANSPDTTTISGNILNFGCQADGGGTAGADRRELYLRYDFDRGWRQPEPGIGHNRKCGRGLHRRVATTTG